MEVATESSYTSRHKAYYQRNKESILARYKEAKPYKAFYERNRERLKARALERYYEKKLIAELASAETSETPDLPASLPDQPAAGASA